MPETTVVVTLVIKGNTERARQELAARLNVWFTEDAWTKNGNKPAPFKDGSLLFWSERA